MTRPEWVPVDSAVVVVDGVTRCGYCGGEATSSQVEQRDTYYDARGHLKTARILITVEPCRHARIEAPTSGDDQ